MDIASYITVRDAQLGTCKARVKSLVGGASRINTALTRQKS